MPHSASSTIAACLFVVVLFFGAAGVFFVPQTAYAQSNITGAFVDCSENVLQTLLINLVFSFFSSTVPTVDVPQVVKEGVKDCAAWAATNAALEEMTAQVVEHVNTGFNGNPAYVTSISRALQLAADSAFLGLVEGGELDGLPRPFRDDVMFALIDDYNMRSDFGARMTSTLDEGLYDIDAFVAGDFSQGGWNTWFKLTQEPQNNPYGAFILAQEEAERRIQSSVEQKELELEAGRLFQNAQFCQEVEVGTTIEYVYEFNEETGRNEIVGTNEVPLTETQCAITTPGAVIQESLQDTLGLGAERAVEADELNEGLSTLMVGLISEILSSEGGLLGSSEYIQESSAAWNEIGSAGGGSGGGPVNWGCLHEFSGQPASQAVDANLGSFSGSGTSGGTHIKRRIPGTEVGKFYKSATFDLDVDGLITGDIVSFARSRITGTYAGWWGAGFNRNNFTGTYLDSHGLPFQKQRASWSSGPYHITVVHDAESQTVTFTSDGGHNHTFGYPFGADIADTGDGLFVWLPDKVGYEYQNITVHLEPGGPYSGGVRGPCSGNTEGGGNVTF